MSFLQPAMFWGALALVIPVAIHFWYQKKGKTIAWAATQWLMDKTVLKHRGIRLDEIPLLILRCILIALLVALLAKPVWDEVNAKETKSVVHLVEPDAKLVSNFRFELEEALKRGERIFLLSSDYPEIKHVEELTETKKSKLNLQKGVLHASRYGTALHVYIRNQEYLLEQPKVMVPVTYKLYTLADSTEQHAVPYIAGAAGEFIFRDPQTGLLTVEIPKNRLPGEPVNGGNIKVLLNFKNQEEQHTLQAALSALQETYSIPLESSTQQKQGEVYDWILSDQPVKESNAGTFYVRSGLQNDGYIPSNVAITPDSMLLSASQLVRNGQLPEWLGNKMVEFYRLNMKSVPLSKAQLHARFEADATDVGNHTDLAYRLILLCFVLIILLERWISMNKNVSQTYA